MKAKLLSSRQKQVLLFTVFRFTKEEIGARLNKSPHTIDTDLRMVFKILKSKRLVTALVNALVLNELTLQDIKWMYYITQER